MNRKARREAAKSKKFCSKQAIAIEKKQAAYVPMPPKSLLEKRLEYKGPTTEAERLALLPETVRVEKCNRIGDYLVLWGHDTSPIFARRDYYDDAIIVADLLRDVLYLHPLLSMSPTAISPWISLYNKVREAINAEIVETIEQFALSASPDNPKEFILLGAEIESKYLKEKFPGATVRTEKAADYFGY